MLMSILIFFQLVLACAKGINGKPKKWYATKCRSVSSFIKIVKKCGMPLNVGVLVPL